jgi:hypothetical protein
MIVAAEASAPTKVGGAMWREAADAVDATLFERRYLGLGAHQAIRQHDVSGREHVEQRAQ